MYERLDRKCMKDQIENVWKDQIKYVSKTRQKMYKRLERRCMKEYIENE